MGRAGVKALVAAAKAGHFDLVDVFPSHGVNINTDVIFRGAVRRSILAIVTMNAKARQIDILEFLIRRGAALESASKS